MGWGARFRGWFGGPANPGAPTVVRFSNPTFPVDQLLLYMYGRVGTVTRADALGVPAVLRGRNLICSVSTLPLQVVDADNRVINHPLVRQIDANVPNVVTLAMIVEDLLFDAVSWLRITSFSGDGYPAAAQRYSPGDVSLQPPAGYELGYLPSGLPTEGVIWMGGQPVPFSDVIRFDSPNPALLVAGQRAIRRAIALDKAADLYASNQRMRGFFTPTDGVDPADDKSIEDMLTDFATARGERLDGYIPAALTYNPIQDPTPAEIQLIAQQQRADLALANALGIDPEDLGINVTSRTYQNAIDRRKDRINDVLATYMTAVTGRLSMPDVTKRGNIVRFNLDDYLKADPKTRAEINQIYVDMGASDPKEVRQEEGKAPRAIAAAPALRPAVPNTQISAIPAGAR